MKRFSEQFHKKAQSVKLKKAEQADLRARIVSYMEYHPLPAEMREQTQAKVAATQPLVTEPFATYTVPFAQLFKFGGVFAAIVLIVIPFVAERAVPGDTLYAVKVNINEEVRSTLTWDSYEKVEWETVRLNRRIAEAKLLEKEGLLTEEVSAEVAAAVKQHADNAKAEIETLRASDADEAAIAAIELDANLSIQAEALVAAQPVDEAASSTESGTTLIAFAIDQSLDKEPVTASSSLPALPKLIARVEEHTTRVRELEAALANQVEADVLADVTRRIEDMERVAGGAFVLPEDEVAEAQVILVDVVARAQKLIVYMTELEVRETVAIETIVPVVLTTEEQNHNRAVQLEEIDDYLEQISTIKIEDEAVTEKVARMTEELTVLRAGLDGLTDYSAFAASSTVARALGQDIIILTEQAGAEVVTREADLPIVASSTDAIATSTATTTETVAVETPVEEVAEGVVSTTTELTLPDTEVTIPGNDTIDEQLEVASTTATTTTGVDEVS